MRRPALALALLAVAATAGCAKDGDKAKIVGGPERVPVLVYEQKIVADTDLADIRVTLPEPFANADWPQAGGSPAKAMHHLTLPQSMSLAWARRIGKGDSVNARLVTGPVVADGRLFVIDTAAHISALSVRGGETIWSTDLRLPKENRTLAFGGGVGVDQGRLFATSGYGLAAAYEAASGKQLWQVNLGTPLRGAPAIADNRVFVMTLDNRLLALNAATGETLWEATGLLENAGLLGAAASAATPDTVVVGFSSGELNALKVENGRTTWQDSLSRSARLTALADLTDIDGSPVIDRGRVFAIGHAGRIVALDLASGQRVWEQNIGGVSTPWVAGDYVYVISNESDLYCLTRGDGKVRWVSSLQRYKNIEKRKGLISWRGPALAGDRLLLTSSDGYLASVSPYNGAILSIDRLKDGSYLSPVVASNMLFVMTQDARIMAFR